MVATAMTASAVCQSQRSDPNATYSNRSRPTVAASLVQIAMKAVTGVGAPW